MKTLIEKLHERPTQLEKVLDKRVGKEWKSSAFQRLNKGQNLVSEYRRWKKRKKDRRRLAHSLTGTGQALNNLTKHIPAIFCHF